MTRNEDAYKASENYHLKNKIIRHLHKKHRIPQKDLPAAASLYGIQLVHHDTHAFQNLRHDETDLEYTE